MICHHFYSSIHSELIFTEPVYDTKEGIQINCQTNNNLPYADDTVITVIIETLQRLLTAIKAIRDQL